MADVAAGDGALHTLNVLSVATKRKSSINSPLLLTAWALTPAG